jgi:hypothetical protein
MHYLSTQSQTFRGKLVQYQSDQINHTKYINIYIMTVCNNISQIFASCPYVRNSNTTNFDVCVYFSISATRNSTATVTRCCVPAGRGKTVRHSKMVPLGSLWLRALFTFQISNFGECQGTKVWGWVCGSCDQCVWLCG